MSFWNEKSLAELTRAEWESLCDGCGRCCLVKLQDEESGRLHYTAITCAELDLESCRCSHYQTRLERIHDCVELSAATLNDYPWLPRSCAYRLLAAGVTPEFPRPAPPSSVTWHNLLFSCALGVLATLVVVRLIENL